MSSPKYSADVEGADTSLTGNGSKRGGWASKLLVGAVVANGLLTVILMGLVIWMGTDMKNKTDAHEDLLSGGAILSSSSKVTIPGHRLAGSLFTGSGYWTSLKPMGASRSDHAAVAYNNLVYLIAGLSAKDTAPQVLDSVVAYDVEAEEYIVKAPMPQARYRFAHARVGNMLYVLSGLSVYDVQEPLPTTLAYNFDTNTWITLDGPASAIPTPRSDACAAAVNGKIYVAGGFGLEYALQGSVDVFDPITSSWSTLPAGLATPRGDCRAVDLGNELVVIGGNGEQQPPPGVQCWEGEDAQPGACIKWLSSVETYDTVSRRWGSRASINVPRGDFAADVLPGGRVIILGGETGVLSRTELALHSVEEYHAADDSWVVKAPLPEARFRFSAVVLADRVYAFGGHPTCSTYAEDTLAKCHNLGLDTVYGYYDVAHPAVYLHVKSPK